MKKNAVPEPNYKWWKKNPTTAPRQKVNTSLGLFNDLASEGESVLE